MLFPPYITLAIRWFAATYGEAISNDRSNRNKDEHENLPKAEQSRGNPRPGVVPTAVEPRAAFGSGPSPAGIYTASGSRADMLTRTGRFGGLVSRRGGRNGQRGGCEWLAPWRQ